MSQSNLKKLRSSLNALRRRRSLVRWSLILCAILLALCWIGLGLFILDWSFEPSVAIRIGMLGMAAILFFWAFWKYAKPWWGHHESEEEMALIVEQNQQIDSDLIAALQFESHIQPNSQSNSQSTVQTEREAGKQAYEDAQWGSGQLQQAVVDYVAEYSPKLNVFEGFSRETLGRRAGLLFGTLVLIGLAIAYFPKHGKTFLNRMGLAADHYPTRTQIVAIYVNQEQVYPNVWGDVFSPQGEAIQFEVSADGVIPSAGVVKLIGEKNGMSIEIPLEKLAATKRNSSTSNQDPFDSQTNKSSEPSKLNITRFSAQLPKLVDSLTYQVYLGDAWTDPLKIHVIPLPRVSLMFDPQLPAYAKAVEQDAGSYKPGDLHISVIENSAVGLSLHCTNKRLREVSLTLNDQTFPLKSVAAPNDPSSAKPPSSKTSPNKQQSKRQHKADRSSTQGTSETATSAGKPAGAKWNPELFQEVAKPFVKSAGSTHWTLPLESSPLQKVTEPIRYTLQVVDEHGLTLERPLQGVIGIKTDHPPRIAGAVTFSRYMKKGKPTIEYGVADDYGLSRLMMKVEILHDARNLDPEASSDSEVHEIEIPLPKENNRPVRNVRNTYTLFLKQFDLDLNDQLKITLEAFDDRGDAPPQSKVSEPILFRITDRLGLNSDLDETNKLSERQINAIIQQELGVGASQ